MMAGPPTIEFVPHLFVVNPSFWNKFTEIKLDTDKLSENTRNIWGYFSNLDSGTCSRNPIEVDSTSFNEKYDCQALYIPVFGKILNKNTIESFKDLNKNELIENWGNENWLEIKEKALFKPAMLNTFYILSYADLKKYHYYYWFAYPCLVNIDAKQISNKSIEDHFNKNELSDIYEQYQKLDIYDRPFFIINHESNGLYVKTLRDRGRIENCYFAFCDTSMTETAGFPLRNYILYIYDRWPELVGKQVRFISFRLCRKQSTISCSNSRIFIIQMQTTLDSPKTGKWTGWEKNERGKFGPKFSNMKDSMDPKRLAESAVDLNLKLMKWRLLPNIDLEKIKATKFLLLGSGTLGCSVARVLLGWGARHITFVDNATVSFSNPVRQSLFTYEDCVKSMPKSVAAAESLKKIFPSVHSRGFQISVPMPGHQVGAPMIDQTKKDIDTLVKLIREHDVIFLLMDSRESRWLPTLLGSYFNKIVINSALGFDTYLVMRHGANCKGFAEQSDFSMEGFKVIEGENLGCYFCNDVTAPGNSLRDRTLDQQCTVTRPGISQIAGALAAEIAIAVIQHPKGNCAPAFYKSSLDNSAINDIPDDCILGFLPHSIRGFLITFNHILPAVHKFKQCIACSDVVLKKYEEKGVDFLFDAFNNGQYLEDITGLTQLRRASIEAEIWDLNSEENDTCSADSDH